eukprot:5301241-Pyramimonas_sp.AAC.1
MPPEHRSHREGRERALEGAGLYDGVLEGGGLGEAPASERSLNEVLLGDPSSSKRLHAKDTLIRDRGRMGHGATRVPPSKREPLMCQEGPPCLEP